MKCTPVLWLLFAITTFYSPVVKSEPNGHLKYKPKTTAGCPQIDDSHIIITPSDCNGSNGGITGITASGTGTLKFTWYDSDLVVVGKNADLAGVPPGKYKLSVQDQSKCTPTIKYYTVGQASPVVIDDSEIKIKPSGCGNTGSITNIIVKNGGQYQWLDAFQTQVSATLDLKNVGSGYYTLVASNANGCSSTATYQVPNSISFPQVARIDTANGFCNGLIGSLTLTINASAGDPPYTYVVLDATGQQVYDIGGNNPISGTIVYSDGTPIKITFPIYSPNSPYSLVVANPNNCSTVIGQYSLPVMPFELLTTSSFFLVRNDACGRHTGGVFNLKVSQPKRPSGSPPPQYWTWTDSLGTVVGHFPDLTGVGKGTYTVVVKDIAGCEASKQFTIQDSTAEAYPPVLTSKQISICLPGVITESVVNPNIKFKYRLYDSTQTAVTENNYGIFQVKVAQTSSYYVTTIDGFCESDETAFKVIVVAPGVVIPNTFTPNHDGINDYWDIPHIAEFPGAEIDVFNREGQLVFHSVNYSHPFDGNYNGSQLPDGVYYYTINLKQRACFGKISGSLTIIR
jgi:gliding motility-associated-like protein